ncbi:MAG: hydrogenase expression/formation protein HypE [Nitrospinota bacterium]
MNIKNKNNISDDLICPVPIDPSSTISLAHGGGGRLTQQLIERIFRPAFDNPELETQHDGAVIDIPQEKMVFTTDSYVVQPLQFPGGDIGSLSVNGTVNDLAMCGARPLYLTVGFILEEGLPMTTLWNVVQSMRKAADNAGVKIITGDTKVVDKGKGDGIFINTAGVGILEHSLKIHPKRIEAGDSILLSGDIGQHGIAIMAARENLGFESQIESDCASVSNIVQNLLDADIEIRCMRDLTRGGLATALVEIAQTSNKSLHITESEIPIREDVKSACEILGFDPLYIANEGRFITFVNSPQAQHALEIVQKCTPETKAALIGNVGKETGVNLKTKIGTSRTLDMLSGEQLPRIC